VRVRGITDPSASPKVRNHGGRYTVERLTEGGGGWRVLCSTSSRKFALTYYGRLKRVDNGAGVDDNGGVQPTNKC
jgi:hypothetical protein